MGTYNSIYYREHIDDLRRRAREKYWEHRQERIEYSREYRKANKEKISAYNRFYNNTNKEKITEKRKQSYIKHKETRNKEVSEYKRTHKEQICFYERNRRFRKKQGGNLSLHEWESVMEFYGRVCLCCGATDNLTVDHVIPLKLGGENSVNNVQPLCNICNSKKGIKVIDFREKVFK